MKNERYVLAAERIAEIPGECHLTKEWNGYFHAVSAFILKTIQQAERMENKSWEEASLEQVRQWNQELYQDILPEQYDNSFANPTYAVQQLGKELGQVMCALYAELYSLISYCHTGKEMAMTIRMELFLELYHSFLDCQEEGKLPTREMLQEIYYWFASDYCDAFLEEGVKERYVPGECFWTKQIEASNLTDMRYLYRFGEYVTSEQEEMAQFMNCLPEEKVQKMADTYTQGYRKGFQVAKKDLSSKSTVNVVAFLGMERMVKKAFLNFREIGLEPIIFASPVSFLEGRRYYKNGYHGAIPNRQFEYDHEQDNSLYLDGKYNTRKLECYGTALETYKEAEKKMSGPAVVESFGEKAYQPMTKEVNLRLEEKHQKLSVEYQGKARQLVNQYVKGEETSFTIIAFPTPAIGPKFSQAFEETIALNTLEYEVYKNCQQAIIDQLDQAQVVRIKGKGNNETDLTVALHALGDPQKETNFENCVADVNIPVGEVFTSPKLSGTNGILHVTKVFLNELEYKDLKLTFTDGMISEYSCKNFPTEEENKAFILEKILHHHETLPMGEFAIGTNTTAYEAARRLEIEDVLPILIAEKMGPHFAVGDTCYSMEEDVKLYNPDGKEIVAKENECSAKRKENPALAYFQCHTDITIPYDELDSIIGITKEGKEIPIIQDGIFVVKGCEELNKPLQIR